MDRRRGYFEDSELRSNSTFKYNPKWIRETITKSTFALAYDQKYFVLIHSLNGRNSCIMTTWTSDNIGELY